MCRRAGVRPNFWEFLWYSTSMQDFTMCRPAIGHNLDEKSKCLIYAPGKQNCTAMDLLGLTRSPLNSASQIILQASKNSVGIDIYEDAIALQVQNLRLSLHHTGFVSGAQGYVREAVM